MNHKILVSLGLCLLALALAACAGLSDPVATEPTIDPSEPISNDEQPSGEAPISPLDPIPGEDKMRRGEVVIEKSEVLIMESYPLQVMLSIQGTLSTPCHRLRAKLEKPDGENRIQVEVYSLVDPNEICVQMLEDFETNLPLGSYPDGSYTIWLNGVQVGEFKQ
ncbi:MAG: hypothetical protein JSV61_07955 [Anaerolineales bacterium]|nr:MAG: hypothetical protein JSV61_07955 [Anaerolineales bacterium]